MEGGLTLSLVCNLPSHLLSPLHTKNASALSEVKMSCPKAFARYKTFVPTENGAIEARQTSMALPIGRQVTRTNGREMGLTDFKKTQVN